MSKRRHNFGTKRFKEKSLFIFHARIALKSLILLFVRLIAQGQRTSTVTLAHARRGLIIHRAPALRVSAYNRRSYVFFCRLTSELDRKYAPGSCTLAAGFEGAA